MASYPNIPPLSRPARRGFTLVELMVSIFLLLLIMVGINQVFTSTSGAIGANQSVSGGMRESRAINSVLGVDFGSMATDGAAIIIKSEQVYAFTTRQDQQIDVDGNANTSDLTASGTEVARTGADYNNRSHRRDRMSFFTRQLLRRQTGNNNSFVADQSSYEQWVWLGHLNLPEDTRTTFYVPGDTSVAGNVNNLYGSQWALGRMVMHLVEPSGAAPPGAPAGVPGTIANGSGVSQYYIYRGTSTNTDNTSVGTTAGTNNNSLSPLAYNSDASDGVAANMLQTSRYDLAGMSISRFSTLLQNYVTYTPAAANKGDYWTNMMGGPTTRFEAIPFPLRPLTSASMARTTPIFASGVSQFMVEYAGDFVSQTDDGTANTGNVIDCYFDAATGALKPAGQDGKIDFYVKNPGTVNAVRSIRWYGMPRSTSGNPTLAVTNGDVCPLRDTIRLAGGAYASLVTTPVEKITPASSTTNPANNLLPNTFKATPAEYFTVTGANGGMSSGTSTGFFYIAAWAPADTVRPKLYRIVMTLEDPNGRLQNGQTFEYVYAVP